MLLEESKRSVNSKRHYDLLGCRNKYDFYCKQKEKKIEHRQSAGIGDLSLVKGLVGFGFNHYACGLSYNIRNY